MIKLGLFISVSIALVASVLSQRTGGSISPVNIPFDVVYLADNLITCSGVIISSTVVITAAHCIPQKYKQSSVYAGATQLSGGSASGVRKHVDRTLTHEHYNGIPGNGNNDIALLFLRASSPFVFDGFIQPAVLPSEFEDYQQTTTQAFVASWGEDRLLKSSVVRLVSRDRCISLIGDIGKNVICAGFVNEKTDACKDTSGGALYIGKKVVGLGSFGWTCGIKDRPAGYTDIAKLRKWIYSHTGV